MSHSKSISKIATKMGGPAGPKGPVGPLNGRQKFRVPKKFQGPGPTHPSGKKPRIIDPVGPYKFSGKRNQRV